MTTVPAEKLEKVLQRYEFLQYELSQRANQPSYAQLAKEYSELGPLVATIRDLRKAEAELADLRSMIADASADKALREMAQEELAATGQRVADLEQTLRLQLLPKDLADDKSAILEVRAGTGGDEAALFAADLFRMYSRYADLRGWKTEIISLSENDLGGYKEVVASITGKGAFARLKYESGVHRVQRVPATEASGRIHTSAATVAVLPEAEDVELDIKPDDIRIDTMRAGGAGGQHVNKTDSAVRITHLPTGLIVVSAEKSQHQNRRLAMQVLRSRLYEMQRQKADDARAAQRKGQVGSGDRSQRIRTYNFPQGRVTDHRIGLTLHKLDQVLDGTGLDELVDALVTENQASQLAAMEQDARADTPGTAPAVHSALAAASAVLAHAGVENAGNDARRLLASVLDLSAAQLLAAPERQLSEDQAARFARTIARRRDREPVSRILGEREFYGRPFRLSPATLDPRPDSETLIEAALGFVRAAGLQAAPLRILDVGTGTGCLLLTLLAELPNATGLGTDISQPALDAARDNAARLGLSERAQWRVADTLDGIDGPFDLLVCNPPYIRSGDIAGLEPEVRTFDPIAALDGGGDGLDIYRRLAPRLPVVVPGGWAVLEVGHDQAEAVAKLLGSAAGGAQPLAFTFHYDVGGIRRCVACRTRAAA